MSRRERKIDQLLSFIILVLYAVVIAAKWIIVYTGANPSVVNAISITGTVIQCLMICVVLYNALGWTGNIVLKIVFIVIAAFLIVSSVIVWVPAIQETFLKYNIPIV